MKTKITLTVDDGVWKDFSVLVSSEPQNFVNRSQTVEDFMRNVLSGTITVDRGCFVDSSKNHFVDSSVKLPDDYKGEYDESSMKRFFTNCKKGE